MSSSPCRTPSRDSRLQNKRVVYDLLFQASAATLLEVARTPKHLGAALGFLSVLHTWGQTLLHHPHVHCVVPAGGLSPDGTRWVHARPSFFLPVKVLSRVFRGKVVAGLRDAFRAGTLTLPSDLQRLTDERAFAAWLRTLFRHDWVVYAKPPFGGPSHVLHYLARYTHRVAISNHRLVAVTEDQVTFRWKDYRHGSRVRLMTLSAEEFLRRFCLHVLPKGFVRIRFYGFLAPRCRTEALPRCRHALGANPPPARRPSTTQAGPRPRWSIDQPRASANRSRWAVNQARRRSNLAMPPVASTIWRNATLPSSRRRCRN